MELIGDGDWDSARLSDLINESLTFAIVSGLQFDASRTEIIDAANHAIGESDHSERLTAMLCMLGESVVIVPNDSLDGDDWSGELSSILEAGGFSTFSSKIGALR